MTALAANLDAVGIKRSLILAGGGMRVAWQAGALLALQHAGLTFSHFDGSSGGTINLAMLLSGVEPREMVARWCSLDVKHFVSLLPLHRYFAGGPLPSMGDARGLSEMVFPHLGIDAAAVAANRDVQATFNVCDFERKVDVALPQARMSLDLLIAAISLPMMMPAVRVNGVSYTDAVWIKDANLMEAVRRGAEEIWLLWCIGNTPIYHDGMFRQYVHMIEMSAAGVLAEELDHICEINRGIEAGYSPYGQTEPIRLHVIKPEYALPLDPDFVMGHIDAATLCSLGYGAAQMYLKQCRQAGVDLIPEVTRMQEPGKGLMFREKMSGSLWTGATDPKATHPAGAGEPFVMHASVSIDDMDLFLADPNHNGTLSGTVDYAPFAEGLLAHHGVFRLFSPAAQLPGMRLMVYEMGFEWSGKSYYLSGRKEVHDDAGFDLWSDTTTLFSTLHEGTDSTGPILAAGVLRLGVAELLKLLSTMHVTGTETASDKAEVYAQFGKFFLGQLWEEYGVHVPGAAR